MLVRWPDLVVQLIPKQTLEALIAVEQINPIMRTTKGRFVIDDKVKIMIRDDMDDEKLFGFIIDNDIQLDIANKRLFRITTETSGNLIYFGSVSLSDTPTRLLVFLLRRAKDAYIAKEDILQDVWENNDLTSSTQRLWKTMKELRLKLEAIGLEKDFILNVKGSGYTLNYQSLMPLFYE